MSRGEGSPRRQGLTAEAAEDIRVISTGGAVQIAGQLTSRVFASLFQIVAANVVARSRYGLYRKVVGILSAAGQVGLAGFNYASMRFITRARARGDHSAVRGAARVGLGGTLIASSIVVTAMLIGAGVLAEVFSQPGGDESELARLIRVGSVYVPLFAVMQVLRYCTQAYKTMVPSVIAGNIVQPVARFVLGVGVLVAGAEVTGMVGSLIASVALGAIAAGWFYSRMLTAEERAAAPSQAVGPMLRFALPQGGSSLLGIQSLGLGVLVLGAASSNAQVALFGVAMALQGPGTLFLSGIVNIWAPVVSDLHAGNEIDRLGSLYQTINRWIATFSFPVFAALMIESDLFVQIFGGSKYADAASVVAILAIGNMFYTGTGPTGYVLSMTGRPGVNFANSIVAVGLYAGIGAAVVPDHGAVGMAIVDMAVTAAVNSARVIEAWVLVGVQPFGKSFVKPVVATIVGAAVLLLWQLIPDDAVWVHIAGIVVAACVYLGTLVLLGMDAEERYVWARIRARAFRGRPGS